MKDAKDVLFIYLAHYLFSTRLRNLKMRKMIPRRRKMMVLEPRRKTMRMKMQLHVSINLQLSYQLV